MINASAGQSDINIILPLVYLWDGVFSHFHFSHNWADMFLFPFYHISNGNRRKKQTGPKHGLRRKKV